MIKMNVTNKDTTEEIKRKLHSLLRHNYFSNRKEEEPQDQLYNTNYGAVDASNESGASIDNILEGDLEALLDKIKNTSSAVTSRINIHNYINDRLDYNAVKVGTEILHCDNLAGTLYAKLSDKRGSMLASELLALEKQKLDEKVKCWQDIIKPMEYFTDILHKYKQTDQDKKLIE